jgi:LysM repeat protein
MQTMLNSDYISRQEALEHIAEARAEVEAAKTDTAQMQTTLDSERKKSEQTIAMLQQEVQKRKALEEKLTADYISRQEALEHIAEARAEVEATKTVVAQMQTKVDSEHKKSKQTIATLQQETHERRTPKERPAEDEGVASGDAIVAKAVAGRSVSLHGTDEYRGPGDGAAITGEPAGDIVHVIQAEENLSSIGAKYGISWMTLAKHNDLPNPNAIFVGQKLRVPVIPATQEEVLTGETTHTVQPGENLRSIGRTYGVGWRQIVEKNGIVNSDNIRIGRLLIIPVDGDAKEQ